MKIRIETQRRYDPVLRQMAADGGVSLEQLAEIAIYNVVALYLKDKGEVVVEGDASVTLPPRALDPVGRL